MSKDAYILASNLTTALVIAISTLKTEEAKISKDFCSALRTGLEDSLRNLRENGYIEVRPSTY